MAETGTLIIESPEDMSDSYISGGVCPGCGGRGCPVEEVSE